jgi:hypothetical protein
MILEKWEQRAIDHLMYEADLNPITWHYANKTRSKQDDGWLFVFKTQGRIPHVKALPLTDKEVKELEG